MIPKTWIAPARAAMMKWRVPASVQIAQSGLESGWGIHAPGNSLGGMKPRAGKNDPCQMLATTEWDAAKQKLVPCQQPFRTFPTIAAYFDAHAELLATARVYADAMRALPNLDKFIDGLMPVRDATGKLIEAGYATDPLYAAKLKALIRQDGLVQYDAGLPALKAA